MKHNIRYDPEDYEMVYNQLKVMGKAGVERKYTEI